MPPPPDALSLLLYAREAGTSIQKLGTWISTERKEDLEALRELLEAGNVTPVVDRTFPLSEVPEAIRYLRDGRAHGKVVITV
jgi:NADPH:quinone reductase-like Zn-dependent oxidoreductase